MKQYNVKAENFFPATKSKEPTGIILLATKLYSDFPKNNLISLEYAKNQGFEAGNTYSCRFEDNNWIRN